MQDHELNIDQQTVCQQNIGGTETGQDRKRERKNTKTEREMEGGESVWWWLEVEALTYFLSQKRN